jgi:hypothetical protein
VQQIVADIPTERWLDVMAGVAAALDGQGAAVGEDLHNLALRENPELRGDKAMLACATPCCSSCSWGAATRRPPSG